MPPRLMLLDTPSLYYRAFFGVPTNVRSPRGEPVNAVRGLLDIMARLIGDHRPDLLVATMDHDWRPDFRVALLPSYKAHRVADEGVGEDPDELEPQVPIIEAVLAAAGIAVIGAAGFEADDVVGTLATRHEGPVDVVTGDRDLFQLVDDARSVRVLYPGKGLSQPLIIDEAAVTARYGIPGRAYAELALLRGDPSDGLPGVPGVGEKTAARLIATHGTVAALLARLEIGPVPGVSPLLRTRILEARAYLHAAARVVPVVRDVPLPPLDPALPPAPVHPDDLDVLIERWGLHGPAQRLVAAMARRER